MHRAPLVACVATVGLLAAACGGSSKSSGTPASPQAAVSQAVSAFRTGKSGKITATVFGSAADLKAVFGSSQNKAGQSSPASIDKLIGDSRVELAFERGSTPTNGKFELNGVVDGVDKAVHVVYDGGIVYIRADLKTLSSASGTNLAKDAQSLSTELPFVKTIVAGNYISLDFTSGTGKAVAPALLGGLGKLPALFDSALTSGTTVTKVGSDSTGDHYRVVGQSQQFVREVEAGISSLPAPLPSLLNGLVGDVNKIPNTPVTIDVWLSGTTLKQMELDLRQFDQGAGGPANPVGLRLAFSGSSGGISAPSNATPVDLAGLAPLLSMLGGSSTTTTTAAK